jgi:hypothetical protein
VCDCSDVRSSIARLADQAIAPELIAVCQARPGEVAPADMEHLRRLAPLARLVGVLGSWCEGELRSGDPWPAVERVYWHQWPAWVSREIRSPRDAGWRTPPTATVEERWLANSESWRAVPCTSRDGAVAILSARRAHAEMLCDACRLWGLRAICFDRPPTRVSDVSLAIWDGDRCGAEDAAELRAFAVAIRPAHLVALLTFPRIDERDRALSAGASRVLSKPLCLEQLIAGV